MDSSGSSSLMEAQAYLNANEPHQTVTISSMDLAFYNAAAEGKIQVFEGVRDSLDLLLTPNKNTILHIYITSLTNTEAESTTKFVEEILNLCPPLLQQSNKKGETPLHIAARYGHVVIVELLIQRVTTLSLEKVMIRMTNKWKDTALHEAVRYNHLEVVKLLLREDPDFVHSANESGETLLYMAVERGFRDVAFEILKTCNSKAYFGPLCRTALHAAALQDDGGMIKKITEKISGLTKQADQKGFTPLHLAAGFHCLFATKELLEHDRQVAYIKDTKGRIALHIAAYEGDDEMVKALVSRCPDCCELVDNRGWNVLHFSITGEFPKDLVKLLLENPSLKNLLNEKDLDGNTTFLIYSKTNSPILLEKLIEHPIVDKMAINNESHSALDMVEASEKIPIEKDFRTIS